MSELQLAARARVVVIGGGIIGCSVAYHLAHMGWKDVAPHRQWVLSLPMDVRFPVARDARLFTRVLRAFLRVVFAWQRRRARAIGLRDPKTASVSFLQ